MVVVAEVVAVRVVECDALSPLFFEFEACVVQIGCIGVIELVGEKMIVSCAVVFRGLQLPAGGAA